MEATESQITIRNGEEIGDPMIPIDLSISARQNENLLPHFRGNTVPLIPRRGFSSTQLTDSMSRYTEPNHELVI